MCFAVGPLIGRHCGTKIPPEIQSSTGILSLTFHTDMAVAKDGFSASYNMTLKEVNDSKYCFLKCFFFVMNRVQAMPIFDGLTEIVNIKY